MHVYWVFKQVSINFVFYSYLFSSHLNVDEPSLNNDYKISSDFCTKMYIDLSKIPKNKVVKNIEVYEGYDEG